jgi:hypothetical protein
MPTFPNNPEIIFYQANTFTLASTNAIADSLLVRSYTLNDLRKNFFYTAVPAFKGSYHEVREHLAVWRSMNNT